MSRSGMRKQTCHSLLALGDSGIGVAGSGIGCLVEELEFSCSECDPLVVTFLETKIM